VDFEPLDKNGTVPTACFLAIRRGADGKIALLARPLRSFAAGDFGS